ncbi:DUF554 domain-containing protein [Clostridium botulinum]|nr:DUF554 domain-containing protein [Clostridium botulinum]
MPIGVCIDCFCILCGGLIGAKFKNRISHKIKEPLTIIFGICAIAIGIVSFIKLKSLPAVILALIIGTILGESLDLDFKLKNFLKKIFGHFNFKIEDNIEEYMNFYVIVAVTFCASGTNIFGAINEGITGDMSILLSKAVMDIFASAIFATTLGYVMSIIIIPQFIFLSLCFYSSHFIMPLITQNMLLDFIAVGGFLTFILGLSIAKIKHISAVNLLPALLIIFPVSYLFHLF